jgi:CRP/FNR family transcriptional regulator
MHGTCSRCEACPVRHKSICGVLSDDELGKLAKISRRKVVKAHNPVFMDGDDADQYFNVIDGIVKLVKTLPDGKQHIVGLMYPTDFLGQPLSRQHKYTAEAATDVELCCFPRAPFEALLAENPKLERRIFEFTVRELDICRDWTLLLGRKSSYERVASFLYMIARRMSVSGCKCIEGGDELHFRLPFTRAEIADYLGLTLETVSRQLSRLKNKKIIELRTSREISIANLDLLAAVAQIDACQDDIDMRQGEQVSTT